MSHWGITAKNEEQKAAIRILTNDKPYTFLTGRAGTGKTLITQAVGLERTLEEHDFRRLVYTRLQVQLGKEQGFLTGDIDAKTYPFVRPFLDNLEVMSGTAKEQVFRYLAAGDDKRGEKNKKVFFDPIQTMRGGSFHHSYLMIDEAQNLDEQTICGIATRLAEGSKMIFLGNFSQIDDAGTRKPERNGLYKLLEGLYREDPEKEYFDHINLTKVERHPAVDLIERILRDNTMDERFDALERRGTPYGSA